jgi:prepilin-type processing-associated H-X9-DG protein
MRFSPQEKRPLPPGQAVCFAFTLLELLAVFAIVAILAAILLPALAGARERSRGIYCLNNTRQLTLAWQLYADDHDSLLPYNLVMSGTYQAGAFRTNINWVNNVMTWDLSSDNTNLATITQAGLGNYVVDVTGIYHCPSDTTLSGMQRLAGWSQRLRSYSMNAMVGNPGTNTSSTVNVNNPGYKQFLKIEQMPRPTDIFVFLDEHPDSIDDGNFLNREASTTGWGMNSVTINQWHDLPASYHNRSGAFSFADGHAGLHRWLRSSTIVPVIPNVIPALQIPTTPASENDDFEWLMSHMSVEN